MVSKGFLVVCRKLKSEVKRFSRCVLKCWMWVLLMCTTMRNREIYSYGYLGKQNSWLAPDVLVSFDVR